jgi:small GTP-binding protein
VDTLVEVEGQIYRFVDTAGIRRRGKLPSLADRLSVLYAERAIERAHIVLLILDATAGVTTEDASIGGKIADSGRGVVLIFNKWDVVEEREEQAKDLEREAREDLPHLDFAPVVFISAKSGRGVQGIFPRIRRVREEQLRKVPTPELNRFLDFPRDRRTARRCAFSTLLRPESYLPGSSSFRTRRRRIWTSATPGTSRGGFARLLASRGPRFGSRSGVARRQSPIIVVDSRMGSHIIL